MVDSVIQKIAEIALLPVVVIDDATHSAPLGRALIKGGLPCAEITFRTRAAARAIDEISDKFENILIGAGTIIDPSQAEEAVNAGAEFIVTPGLHRKVLEWCLDKQIPVFPGIATASDIALALDYGLSNLKFFPAEDLGGIRTLKSLSAPYRTVKFIPTGGVNNTNLKEYLLHPNVLACGGSWLVKRELIQGQKFDEIEKLVAEATRAVNKIKQVVINET